MKKLYGLVLLLALFVSGCSSTFDLDEKWKPLVQIAERPGADGWITTLGDTVVMANLDTWLEKNPPDSAHFRALISHEQVHSHRQHEHGVLLFLARYPVDKSFRWKEERLGWYVQIKTARMFGDFIWAEGVINSLSSYTPSLASKAEITEWVNAVFQGTWKPDPRDLPEQYRGL